MISSKLVSAVRQNQKTDNNDALAIVQAALLPDVSFIKEKSAEQQQLQSILSCVKQKTVAGNQLTALLAEFNVKFSSRNRGLNGVITATLEDAENGLSFQIREALSAAWQQYLSIVESISVHDRCLEEAI